MTRLHVSHQRTTSSQTVGKVELCAIRFETAVILPGVKRQMSDYISDGTRKEVSEEEASKLRLEALQLFEKRRKEVLLDSDVKLRSVGSIPVLKMAFYTVLKRYNYAIADNLKKLYRHECSLRAWLSVFTEIGMSDEVMAPLFWDHVEPVLFMALDLPGAIKDQVVHATVSLQLIAEEGVSGLERVTSWDSKRNFSWNKHFGALTNTSDELYCLRDSIDQLWSSIEAEELRDDHGKRHHAIAQRLGVGYPRVSNLSSQESDGLSFAYGLDKPLDIAEKIELIDAQRRRAEGSYDALWGYVTYLERCGLQM